MYFEQMRILENGNISPCPYKEKCLNYPTGCNGFSLWCGRDQNFFNNKGVKKYD